MANNYSRGNSNQIIVGAAAFFVTETGTDQLVPNDARLPDFDPQEFYFETLSDATKYPSNNQIMRNVGYTMNGLELQFQPDFGEVQVDQLLDVAKLYKQGMQVNMVTSFAEATLENLVVAIAALDEDYTVGEYIPNPTDDAGIVGAPVEFLDISSGSIGECPVERSVIAVGPGTGDCDPTEQIERIYLAYRVLSIENVTVSAKRDEPTMYEVNFRLLPEDNGSYGRIIDRTFGTYTS